MQYSKGNNMDISQIDKMLNQVGVSLQLTLNKYKELLSNYQALVKFISNKHILSDDDGVIFVQGSFAIDTAIKPLRKDEVDVDMVAMFSQVWTPGMQVQSFYKKLEEIFQGSRYEDMYEVYKNVIRINYSSNYHFDIMPTLPITASNSNSLKAVDTKMSRWVNRFPKLYIDWFINKANLINDYEKGILFDRSRYSVEVFKKMATEPLKEPKEYYSKAPLTRIIQLIKRARDVFFKDVDEFIPQSIVLTTIVANDYKGEQSIYKALLNASKGLFSYAKSNKQFTIVNPVSQKEIFTDKWQKEPKYYENFKKFSYWLLYRVRCLKTENRRNAVYYIEKAFGASARSHIENNRHAREYHHSYLKYNDTYYGNDQRIESKFTIHLEKYVELDCKIKRGESIYFWLRKKNKVLKNGDKLNFTIKNTNVKGDYDVYWKVRNDGDYAYSTKQIRGEITKGIIGEPKVEEASFLGEHYVECYIVQEGVVVATDRIGVPIDLGDLSRFDV